MTRTTYLFAALALACSGPMDPDAGMEGDAGRDGGMDAGDPPFDAGPRPDAGPQGCQSGCDWVELALGGEHSCARRENGEVVCWGIDFEGELGDGEAAEDTCGVAGGIPVECSGPVAVMLDTTPVVPLDDAVSISAQGAGSTCAVRENGEVWCWGPEGLGRTDGAMPLLRFMAVRVPEGDTEATELGSITQVSNGHHHTCALRANGEATCFGFNSSGQLGVGNDRNPIRVAFDPARPVVDPSDTTMALADILEIEASGYTATTCARTAGEVYCWGDNRNGQFGDGLITGHETCMPTLMETYDCSGVPVQVGGALTPLTDVADLAVGFGHICALGSGAEAGTVRCWGDNRTGQIAQPASSPTVASPTAVDTGGTITQVATGAGHTCVLHDDGTIRCWGFNNVGQLGDGTDPTMGENHGMSCMAEGFTGDCSRVPVQVAMIDDARHIGAGLAHNCAIRESNEIWCWGANDRRELGDGTRNLRAEPVRVIGLPE